MHGMSYIKINRICLVICVEYVNILKGIAVACLKVLENLEEAVQIPSVY
jgi:hypothetical protein